MRSKSTQRPDHACGRDCQRYGCRRRRAAQEWPALSGVVLRVVVVFLVVLLVLGLVEKLDHRLRAGSQSTGRSRR